MRLRTSIRGILVVTLVAGMVAGCEQMLAERMVAPPNMRENDGGAAGATPATTRAGMRERRMMVAVGPPKAELAVWVLEPAGDRPVRGTVLVLHGILANHGWVRTAAEEFRTAGFRAVMVDLRGHGESTGEHIGYGALESRDLVQVTDFLQREKLCGATIGVYGVSLGAASGLQMAAIDSRVKAVVAVASFASLREEAPHFGRHMLPVPGLFLSDADYVKVVDAAGKIAGFDPDAASPLAAIQRTTAPVLLIHGALDWVTPVAASQRLHEAALGHSELVVLAGTGHLGAVMDLTGNVPGKAREWFERYLAGGGGGAGKDSR